MVKTRNIVTWATLVISVVSIFFICTFKILDRDFWWHVKSGEIMWNTGKLIVTDPYAHTRIGQPYLSSHQWLAQLAFYGVWNAGGPVGEILFRGALVTTAFLLLLWIDKKRIWPNFFIILIAAYFNRPSFMDRPQLFSFVFFCAFLYAGTYYLRRADRRPDIFVRWRLWFLLILIGLQILWINMHGAAATYGLIVIAALCAERGVQWLRAPGADQRARALRELRFLAAGIIGLLLAVFISPNGLKTFQDVFVYTNDQTLGLVREWQPRGLGGYMKEVAPFALLAVVSIAFGKRQRIFSAVLIGVLGYLSVQSYRHGMFFIFSALAIAIHQAGSIDWYKKWTDILMKNARIVGLSSIVLFTSMYFFVRYNDIHVLLREGYSGYGVAAAAEDAFNFIEKEKITGTMFNTYAIGDYLLYRGYPNRKVYVDGRNIDYGYDFLREATRAGFEPQVWSEIEKKYGLTYAIIEYPLAPGASAENDLPYVLHLSQNTNWSLVYIDDKVAVYVKRLPEYTNLIKRYGYNYITPAGLEFGKVFDGIKETDIVKAEAELERASANSATGIKAKLLLAQHYADSKKYEQAAQFANAAAAAQPFRPESYEALGMVAVGLKQWAQAGGFLEHSIELTGGVGLPINYNYLADIFANAGDVAKSSYYKHKAN